MNPYIRVQLFAAVALLATVSARADYDLQNGNAAFEIVIQTAAPVIFEDVSPTGGDAPLVLRVTTLITNAWYDATAPYNYPAVGVYTRLGWPNDEALPTDNTEQNVALVYASYRVLMNLLPGRAGTWRAMVESAGLDPDDDSVDPHTPIGIGNLAGSGVVNGRIDDGMNQRGNADGRTFNFDPFSDYTGYKPVNTAFKLLFPSRWQPDVQRIGLGIYKIQKFVTPQWRYVEPYAYADANVYNFPFPINSQAPFKKRYKQQADEVLAASAALDDQKKLKAELFDNKIRGLGFAAVFAGLSQGLSLFEFVQLDFITNMAAFDAGIVVWKDKERYDAVRPFSAIRHVYGDKQVLAWAGPGLGTQSIPANEWKSYLEEADHPEYPSASTCFCTAHAQSARLLLGTDQLNWTVEAPAGSSRIEQGITPATDTELFFATWTDWQNDCGQSRVWAGVHFQSAVDESLALCGVFGDLAYDYLTSLVNGTAPPRGPSQGTMH